MTPCPACGRPADLVNSTHPIYGGALTICITCFDHNAVPVNDIIRTTNSMGWKEIPKVIRDAIRVYDLEEYVIVRTWAERMQHRQLVPIDDEEQQLITKMRAVRKQMDNPPPRPRHWWLTVLSWLGLTPAWEASA